MQFCIYLDIPTHHKSMYLYIQLLDQSFPRRVVHQLTLNLKVSETLVELTRTKSSGGEIVASSKQYQKASMQNEQGEGWGLIGSCPQY